MTAEEWLELDGIPAEPVSDFQARVLVNCSVGPDMQTCLV